MNTFKIVGLGTLFAVACFAQAATAASGNELTAREKALWAETFGDGTPAASNQQKTVANISGNWVGYYEYDKPSNQPPGMFNAVIHDWGDQFLISFVEPRYDDEEYVQWAGNTTAKRQGKYIEFTKVYAHNKKLNIQYNLTVSHDGSIMDGTWKIDDKNYGRAFFYRVPLEDLKAIRQRSIE